MGLYLLQRLINQVGKIMLSANDQKVIDDMKKQLAVSRGSDVSKMHVFVDTKDTINECELDRVECVDVGDNNGFFEFGLK
jgi:hypothetical protein